MIQEEFLHEGTLIKHWSDRYLFLLQEETGAKYGEAVDIVPCPYTYSEVEGEYVYSAWEENRFYNKEDRVIYGEKVYESIIGENNEVPTNTEAWKLI